MQFIFITLLLTNAVSAQRIMDGDTLGGVTYNEPWYAVLSSDSSQTLFLIDNDGDLYVGADDSTIALGRAPVADSFISYSLKRDSVELLRVNESLFNLSGHIYTQSTLPISDTMDLLFRNNRGQSVALFEGEKGDLFLTGSAPQIWNIKMSGQNYGEVSPDTMLSIVRGDTALISIEAIPQKGYVFAGWRALKGASLNILDSLEYKTAFRPSSGGELKARFLSQPRYALDFHNRDSLSVELPNMPLNFASGITVEFWMQWDSLSTGKQYLIHWEEKKPVSKELAALSIFAQVDSVGQIGVSYRGGVCNTEGKEKVMYSSAQFVIPQKWTHVTLQLTDSKVQFLKNGILDTTVLTGCLLGLRDYSKNYIGSGHAIKSDSGVVDEQGLYTGMFDELRVWSGVRSSDSLNKYRHERLMGEEEGLLLLYDFNNYVGSTIFDKAPQGYHGRVINQESEFRVRSYSKRIARVLTKGSGTVVPGGSVSVAVTERKPIKATPGRGNIFDHWSADGKVIIADSTQDSTWFELAPNGRVYAHFKPIHQWSLFDQVFGDSTAQADSLLYSIAADYDYKKRSVQIDLETTVKADSLYCVFDDQIPMNRLNDTTWSTVVEGVKIGDSILFQVARQGVDSIALADTTFLQHLFVIPKKQK